MGGIDSTSSLGKRNTDWTHTAKLQNTTTQPYNENQFLWRLSCQSADRPMTCSRSQQWFSFHSSMIRHFIGDMYSHLQPQTRNHKGVTIPEAPLHMVVPGYQIPVPASAKIYKSPHDFRFISRWSLVYEGDSAKKFPDIIYQFLSLLL